VDLSEQFRVLQSEEPRFLHGSPSAVRRVRWARRVASKVKSLCLTKHHAMKTYEEG